MLETNGPNEAPGKILSVVPDHEMGADVDHLPEDVERHYQSARRVLAAGEPDLAAVSLRRAIEAAAAHQDIHERTLVSSVEAMVQRGLITPEFHKVLDHIRKVGNAGAHAGSPPLSEPDVRRALRFTTQVLRNLFEIPAALLEIAQGDGHTDEPSAANGASA